MQKYLFNGIEIFKILPLTHQILKRKSYENYNFTEKEEDLLSTMIDTLKQQEIVTKGEISPLALAAPQVGWEKNLFICANFDRVRSETKKVLRKVEIFINPEILEHSNNYMKSEEICLSYQEKIALVRRPDKIVMKYYNIFGKEKVLEANGFLGCLYQHECDHLKGITVLDKAYEFEDQKN